MRIISGKYKGHHLVSFQASHIRPTTDRVKETMFNIIQAHIEGAKVVDLFSGTGSLGLEALSRGAGQVTFVEQNRKSLDILEKNIEKLKITEGYQIIRKDVFGFLKDKSIQPVDVIFADPPFTEEIAHDVMVTAAASSLFHENTILLIESGRREKIVDDYGHLVRYDVREFGDKTLSFFRAADSTTKG